MAVFHNHLKSSVSFNLKSIFFFYNHLIWELEAQKQKAMVFQSDEKELN